MNGFEHFTNPASARELLQERAASLWGRGVRVADCRILHAHYKQYLNPNSDSKRWLAVSYQVELSGVRGGATDRILYGKAYAHEYNTIEAQRAQHRFPELGLLLWEFPSDPGLPQLAELTDARQVRRLLREHFPNCVPTVSVVNYRPEIRCTLRYCSGAASVYGKAYQDDRGWVTYSHLRQLREQQLAFVAAEPCGYSDVLRTLWTKEVPGHPLLETMHRQNCKELMHGLASALISLQSANLPVADRMETAAMLAESRKKARKLAAVFPKLAPELRRLIGSLEAAAEHLPHTKVLAHGDFHARQVIVDPSGRMALLDFDELTRADGAFDAANFMADLEANGNLDPDLRRTACRHFAEALSPDPKALDWHMRAQYLIRAYRSWLKQVPGLDRIVEGFVAQANDNVLQEVYA